MIIFNFIVDNFPNFSQNGKVFCSIYFIVWPINALEGKQAVRAVAVIERSIMNIFSFDIKTLVGMLFWGNLTCLILVVAYTSTHIDAGDRKLAWHVIIAKSLLTAAFLLVSFRGHIPDYLSVNIGNTLMMAGGYVEARALLLLLNETNVKVFRGTLWLAIIFMLVINLVTFFQSGVHLRIAVGAVGIFMLLIIPTSKLLFSRDSTLFKRIIGLFYLIFIVLQLPRGLYYSSHPEMAVFSNVPIQILSYTSLMLLTIFSLSSFLLLMKEQTDKQLREMATTDFLTGLYNRQFFFRSVKMPFERHQRKQTPCAFMFLDVDHFKRVNDTLGHAFGDEVLVAAASVLREVVRGYDLPCRYGGEEFAVFVDTSNPEAVKGVAERIREKIQAMAFPAQPDFRLTISIGVAIGTPDARDTVDRFLSVADEALYEAKESGRNRVVVRNLDA